MGFKNAAWDLQYTHGQILTSFVENRADLCQWRQITNTLGCSFKTHKGNFIFPSPGHFSPLFLCVMVVLMLTPHSLYWLVSSALEVSGSLPVISFGICAVLNLLKPACWSRFEFHFREVQTSPPTVEELKNTNFTHLNLTKSHFWAKWSLNSKLGTLCQRLWICLIVKGRPKKSDVSLHYCQKI